MKLFKVPFIRINFTVFHHGILNVWKEHPVSGMIWSFHLFPMRKRWLWGRNISRSKLISEFGLGPLFRVTRFGPY